MIMIAVGHYAARGDRSAFACVSPRSFQFHIGLPPRCTELRVAVLASW